MKPLVSFFTGGLVLGAAFFLTGCGSYNKLVASKQAVDRSWADVENVYQRRADLIPNLVKTVEGAANFEKSTLTDVIKARQQVTTVKLDPGAAPTDPAALANYQKSQDALSGALSRLLVTIERYPDLKANANFQELQAQLEGTENRIAVERRKFNEAVQSYNTMIQQVPGVLYAKAFSFPPRPYFAAQAGAETAPDVNFHFGGSPAPTP